MANSEVPQQETKAITVQCPHCGAEYEASQQDMHRNFLCEVCGKDFVVGTNAPEAECENHANEANQTDSLSNEGGVGSAAKQKQMSPLLKKLLIKLLLICLWFVVGICVAL